MEVLSFYLLRSFQVAFLPTLLGTYTFHDSYGMDILSYDPKHSRSQQLLPKEIYLTENKNYYN